MVETNTIVITWLYLILALAVVVTIWGAMTKNSSSRKTRLWIGIIPLAVGLGLLIMGVPTQLGFLNDPVFGKTVDIGGTQVTYSVTNTPTSPTGTTPGTASCPYSPSATFSAKDIYSSVLAVGTSYYKVNGLPATTSAPTPNKGVQYTYWVSNSTYYVKPKTFIGDCGANTIVADSYQNASATVSLYDPVNSQSTTTGVYNTSLGANDQANVRITYQGTAKKSGMPFGGVLVIEYNNTISSVTCTGASLLSSNPFHITYSPSSTVRTYQVFAVSPSIDDGTGSAKTIDCQVLNGATAVGAGSVYYVKFISANYYLTNDGNVVLDVEKYANQDNTRTGIGGTTAEAYWGA